MYPQHLLRYAVSALSIVSTTNIADIQSQPQVTKQNLSEIVELGTKPLLEPMRNRAEIIFNILAADIAIQRGNFLLAKQHYSQSATLAQHTELAELATRAAITANDFKAAAQELSNWLKINSEQTDALRMAVVIAVENKDINAAVDYLQRLIAVYRKTTGNPYTALSDLLEKLNDINIRLELGRRVTKDHLDDPNALFTLANLEFSAKNWDNAEKLARKALIKHPNWLEAQSLVVRTFTARKDSKSAQNFLEQLVAVTPTDIKLREALGVFLLEQNDLPASQQQFMWIYTHDPKHTDAITALGLIALQSKQTEQAINYFNQLYKINSHEDKAALLLGKVYQANNQDNDALQWYAKVLGENKLDAQIQMAQIYAKQGEISKVQEIVQQIRNHTNDESQIDLLEIELFREVKQYSIALEILNAALEKTPDNHELRYTRALTYIQIGQIDAFERDLTAILKADPEYVEALNALGYTLSTETNRYQEAMEYINRALKLKPEQAAILDSVGWVQYRLGNTEQALHHIQKAFSIMPDPEIALHLGEVLWRLGNKEQAIKIWTESFNKSSENEHILKVKERYGIKF